MSFFFFLIWPYHIACINLVPWLGIKSEPLAVKVWSPNHWTAREFLMTWFLIFCVRDGFCQIFACRYYKLTRIRIFLYLPLFLPIKLFLPEVSSFILFGELPVDFRVGLLPTNAVLLCLSISWFSFHSWTIFSLGIEFRVDKFFLSAPGICCFISFWSPRDEKSSYSNLVHM